MDSESFGSCLRRAREMRRLSLHEVAGTTKIPRTTLEQIEAGNLEHLPADVFVRGFIRSFARAVGTDENGPLHGFERALNARRDAERARFSTPVGDPAVVAAGVDDESSLPRRGLGLAVFVIILLLIATITLSLLLRRPPQSGEGLSEATPGSSSSPSLSSSSSSREALDTAAI